MISRLAKLLVCVAVSVCVALQGTLWVSASDLYSANYRAVQREFSLSQTTYEICEKYEVDPEAIFALMWRESRMQIDVPDSATNDRGIMQVNKVNWQWLLDDYGLDVSIPEQNIEAGVLILSMHLEDYTLEESLAAYAAGVSGMKNGKGFNKAKEILDIMDIE